MSKTAVEICADSVDFSFGPHRVLRDVSLTVRRGSRVGIVGESGSGKTTLARLLVGVVGAGVAGVTVNGKPWSSIRRRSDVRRLVQMIFQDPFASLNPRLTARVAVQEAVHICRSAPRHEAGMLAQSLLESVGIGQMMARRRPAELSGGQCQRVSIARAIAADPAILVADEPTSALDLSVQAQILNLLLELYAKNDTGFVIVSHDLAVIRHLTEEIFVMHQGRVVESGYTGEVLDNPQDPYTQKLCRSRHDFGSVKVRSNASSAA
jgi:peptide/nickel transport system ATP-binding protein